MRVRTKILFVCIALLIIIIPVDADTATGSVSTENLSVKVGEPLTIPNQFDLEKEKDYSSNATVVCSLCNYTEGSTSGQPLTASDAGNLTVIMTIHYSDSSTALVSRHMTFNESLSAYHTNFSPSIVDKAGIYDVAITADGDIDGDGDNEFDAGIGHFKALYKNGAYMKLSENTSDSESVISSLKLDGGYLGIKSIEDTTVVLENTVSGEEYSLNENDSINPTIDGATFSAVIIDEIKDDQVYLTVTYSENLSYVDYTSIPEDLGFSNYLDPEAYQESDYDFLNSDWAYKIKRKLFHEDYQPYMGLTPESDSFRDTLDSGNDVIEFTRTVESKWFGLMQKWEEYRITPEGGEWKVTIKAGISFNDWADAGYPLDVNDALDSLLVWDTSTDVKVNWKGQGFDQTLVWVSKETEEVADGVEAVTEEHVDPKWEDLGFRGGQFEEMNLETSKDAVLSSAVAADWSIGETEDISFNWAEMWSSLQNGEVVVSMDFVLEKITLEFTK